MSIRTISCCYVYLIRATISSRHITLSLRSATFASERSCSEPGWGVREIDVPQLCLLGEGSAAESFETRNWGGLGETTHVSRNCWLLERWVVSEDLSNPLSPNRSFIRWFHVAEMIVVSVYKSLVKLLLNSWFVISRRGPTCLEKRALAGIHRYHLCPNYRRFTL